MPQIAWAVRQSVAPGRRTRFNGSHQSIVPGSVIEFTFVRTQQCEVPKAPACW